MQNHDPKNGSFAIGLTEEGEPVVVVEKLRCGCVPVVHVLEWDDDSESIPVLAIQLCKRHSAEFCLGVTLDASDGPAVQAS